MNMRYDNQQGDEQDIETHNSLGIPFITLWSRGHHYMIWVNFRGWHQMTSMIKIEKTYSNWQMLEFCSSTPFSILFYFSHVTPFNLSGQNSCIVFIQNTTVWQPTTQPLVLSYLTVPCSKMKTPSVLTALHPLVGTSAPTQSTLCLGS